MQDGKTFIIGIVAIVFFLITFKGCFNGNNKQQSSQQQYQKFEKSPVDLIIRDLSSEQSFSIILFDMDYIESTDQYKHMYNVLVEREDSVYVETSDWIRVSSTFFNENIDNMGMELASKIDGKVSKVAAPAGYSNYVGNEKYGSWQTHNGNSFWEFYGRYAFMSSMFRMAMYPVHYSYWHNYRTDYYGSGRPYYGPSSNGRNMYGTNSKYSGSNNKSTWNRKSSSFKSDVRSRVSRSTTTASNANKNFQSNSQKTRSSNRYSSSSTRSRGGGYGK